MTDVRDRAEGMLARLIGMPLWAARRAADMLTLQFGEQHATETFQGNPSTVGDYALHVQCPWHWRDASGVVRADKSAPDQMGLIALQRLACVAADAADDGGFCLSFADGGTLKVEPDHRTEPREHWRLFEPTRYTAHFVLTGRGIQG